MRINTSDTIILFENKLNRKLTTVVLLLSSRDSAAADLVLDAVAGGCLSRVACTTHREQLQSGMRMPCLLRSN